MKRYKKCGKKLKHKLHKYEIMINGYENKYYAEIDNKIKNNKFLSKLTFCYKLNNTHNAYYRINNVKGIWSETMKGIVIVIENNYPTVYQYISCYNNKNKQLMINIVDIDRNPITLSGKIIIKLIISGYQNIGPFTENGQQQYYHMENNNSSHYMCR